MCATVRKSSRWKCYQGRKIVIFTQREPQTIHFFSFFICQCALDFLLCFQQLNQKQYTSKEYYQTKGTLFYERWLVWRLKDWSCAAGHGEGGTSLTNVYPQYGAAVAFARQPQSKCHRCCHVWHEPRMRPRCFPVIGTHARKTPKVVV